MWSVPSHHKTRDLSFVSDLLRWKENVETLTFYFPTCFLKGSIQAMWCNVVTACLLLSNPICVFFSRLILTNCSWVDEWNISGEFGVGWVLKLSSLWCNATFHPTSLNLLNSSCGICPLYLFMCYIVNQKFFWQLNFLGATKGYYYYVLCIDLAFFFKHQIHPPTPTPIYPGLGSAPGQHQNVSLQWLSRVGFTGDSSQRHHNNPSYSVEQHAKFLTETM